MTEQNELRRRIAAAIFDPGATEGYKTSSRSLTDWQTDAVMRVLSAVAPSPATAGVTDEMVERAAKALFSTDRIVDERIEKTWADLPDDSPTFDEIDGSYVGGWPEDKHYLLFLTSKGKNRFRLEARAALEAAILSAITPETAGSVSANRQRANDALYSAIGLIRALCSDDVAKVVANELEFVRSWAAITPGTKDDHLERIAVLEAALNASRQRLKSISTFASDWIGAEKDIDLLCITSACRRGLSEIDAILTPVGKEEGNV